jgi:hypothetical protein
VNTVVHDNCALDWAAQARQVLHVTAIYLSAVLSVEPMVEKRGLWVDYLDHSICVFLLKQIRSENSEFNLPQMQ